jgi:hypothetical protein
MDYSNIRIPSLAPWEIDHVPVDSAEFFVWRKKLFEVRVEIQELCTYGDGETTAEQYQQAEWQLCSEDPARWVALWLWIEEPRLLRGEDPIKPFVPFAYQVELCQWFVEVNEIPEQYDGFVSKARGLGASWIFAAMALWAWLFRPWRGILISRKEDLVDKKGDLNSLFGKIDFCIEHLPDWMLPVPTDEIFTRYRMKNFLQHPHTTAALIGEATTAKSTRGGRATFIIYDEAAFIPDFKTVFGTGSGTTYHRWAVSSESFEEGSDWWDMWHGVQDEQPEAVRELNWPLNPYFDHEWYVNEQARWEKQGDLPGFLREYERNPFSDDTWIYPTVRFIKHFDPPEFAESAFPHAHYDPQEVLLVGVDPGRADDTAIVFMQMAGEDEPRRVRWVDSYSRNLMPAEYYAHILTGIEAKPGDTCWGLDFDRYATDVIMPWMRSLPWSGAMRVFCDPSGAAKDMSGKSFTDRLLIESKRLRATSGDASGRRLVGIVPLYEELFAANRHDKRRLELRKMLIRSSFANTLGAKKLKYALEQYRFSDPGRKSTSQPAPLHDAYSHLSTAAEYVAVYCSIGLGRIKPARERK